MGLRPNNSFKPTPHRGVNSVPYTTLHAVDTPPRDGLTQALAPMLISHRNLFALFSVALLVGITLALLGRFNITKRAPAAAYLICASAQAGQRLDSVLSPHNLRELTIRKSDSTHVDVGYRQLFSDRWLCSIAVDDEGRITTSERLL